MLDLYYKTRGEERALCGLPSSYDSLESKPRLYFSCHSADFPLCFPELSQDLLTAWDAAIWFDHSADQPKSQQELTDLEHFLQTIQVLVVVVTPSLLEADCQAWQIEFPFAQQHHIPILPIIPKSVGAVAGLGSRFSTLKGKMHLLNKNAAKGTEETMVPYEQKLLDFLSRSLLGQKQLEEILTEFDIHCFLSYRKEDRAYANALMHYIHQHPQFQDIAIWFDEYLYAGENYTKQIQNHLKQADLCLLLVTPQIYAPNAKGEDNFVVTHEYPDAQSFHCPILPVLVTPCDTVDFSTMQAKFPGLPPCVDVRDPSFSRQLEAALAPALHKRRKVTPEHLYHIGLAYLYGVQVEVDRGRAIELIQQAADAGLDVSVQKLVDMYRTGQGMAQNMPKAIRLQEALINHYAQAYEEKWQTARQLPENMQNLFLLPDAYSWTLALWLLGNDQIEEGDFAGAFLTYHQMLENCQMFLQMGGPIKQLLEQCAFLPIALDNLGDAALRRDDPRQALVYYQEALSYNRLCYESDPSLLNLENLSISYNRMGDANHNLGNVKEALQYYQKERQIVQELCKKSDQLKYQRILAQGYLRMGSFYEKLKAVEQAEAELLHGIQLMESVCQSTQDLEDLRILAIGCHSLGVLYLNCNNLKESETWLVQAYHLRKKLLEAHYNTINKSFMIETCQSLTALYLTIIYPQKSAIYEDTALTLLEEVQGAEQANNLRIYYAREYYNLTFGCLKEQRYFDSANCLPVTLWYCQELIARGYRDYENWLSDCYSIMDRLSSQLKQMIRDFIDQGNHYSRQHDFKNAIPFITNAVACLRSLRRFQSSDDLLMLLIQQYLALGDMREDLSQAEADYREALAVAETHCEKDNKYLVAHATCCKAIAEICEQQNRLEEADAILMQGIQRLQAAYQKDPQEILEYYRTDLLNFRIHIQMQLKFPSF